MKKYIIILIVAIIAGFSACKYETLPTYSGVDQIYFTYAQSAVSMEVLDSVMIKFGYDSFTKEDSIIKINVSVMGSVVDYDRPVKFILVEYASTAKLGQDIDLLPELSFVPAGTVKGQIAVKLKNTDNLNDTVLKASVKLLENEHFKADFNDIRIGNRPNMQGTVYKLLFDNNNEKPNWWSHSMFGSAFNTMLGPYSHVKFAIMCEILPGCTREYFTYGPTETVNATLFMNKFPTPLLQGWGRALNIYLAEYKSTHGVPVYDENGVEVVGGSPK